MANASPVLSLSRRDGLGAYLVELWRRRHFAWHLAIGGIRARTSSTTLGLLWWMLDPLILGGVFLLVFGVILDVRRGDPAYIGFLLSGLFAFTYTRTTMMGGGNTLTANAHLIATQRFPRMVLPVASVVEGAVAFSFSLVPFFLIAGFAHGDWPGPHTLVFLPAFVFHTLFNLGLSLLVAQLVIPFRDIGNVMGHLSRIWMYMSPVIYPLDERLRNAPEALVQILQFNPMAAILGLYRTALLGYPSEAYHWWGSAAWAVGLALLGAVTFRRMEHKLPRYLA
ncbi:MAG: ABC transporter permease [Acidimicrobiia bacterium]|nr:ABC transporter permease [Acidimicrobiia bacterium]